MNEDPSMVWLARRERQERHRCGCMCELHLRDLHALCPVDERFGARPKQRVERIGLAHEIFRFLWVSGRLLAPAAGKAERDEGADR